MTDTERVAPVRGITERWDKHLFNEIRESLEQDHNVKVNPHVRFRVGFAPERNSRNKNVVAEFRHGDFTNDGDPAIFISPLHDDTVLIAAAIERELVRSTQCYTEQRNGKLVQKDTRHFQWYARNIGIIDGYKMEEVPVISDALRARLTATIDKLPPRPHGRMSINERAIPKQSTNLWRGECPFDRALSRCTDKGLRNSWPLCNGNGTHPLVYLDFVTGTQEAGLTPVDITDYIDASKLKRVNNSWAPA